MGSRLAANLAKAGFELVLYNRTRATAERLGELLGVPVAASPAAAAASSDVVVTMLTDAEAVEDVYEQPAGILEGLRPRSVAVDMSTVGPAAAMTLAGLADACGAGFVDAPVSGSVALAESASLTVMAGGASSDVERVMPVLRAIGSTVFHVGAVGAGATIKLAVNTVIYGLCEAVAEGLVLAERAGIERARAYEIFASSAIAAPFVHYRREEFENPGRPPVAFRLALAHKDMNLILSLAASTGALMPQARANLRTLEGAIAEGLGDHDVAAVAEYLRRAAADGNR